MPLTAAQMRAKLRTPFWTLILGTARTAARLRVQAAARAVLRALTTAVARRLVLASLATWPGWAEARALGQRRRRLGNQASFIQACS
jgi:hypothetical protein